MKQRSCQTQNDLDKAASAIQSLGGNLPVVISVTEGRRIRSSSANARYWATLNEHLYNIQNHVNQVVEYTGFSYLEVVKLISKEMPPEQSVILFARTAEVIHDVLKMICGVPTSTRLGTKEFQKFEARMEQTIADIVGEIQAVTSKMA